MLLFKLIKRGVSAVVSLTLFAGVLATGYVLYQSRQQVLQSTDVIVVLGASQFDGRPSPVFESRLIHAQQLFESKVAPHVVTVGGKQPGDRFTEAQSGRRYLIARGVPAQKVSAVPTGSDTLESVLAVQDLMKTKKWKSMTIVSDPAHVGRAQLMAESLGFDVYPAPTQSGAGSEVTPDYVVREVAGLLRFMAWDRWQVQV